MLETDNFKKVTNYVKIFFSKPVEYSPISPESEYNSYLEMFKNNKSKVKVLVDSDFS